jgi:hypothetical protein
MRPRELMGVGTRCDTDSLQYMQAGGTPHKYTMRRQVSATQTTAIALTSTNLAINGNGVNGNGTTVN